MCTIHKTSKTLQLRRKSFVASTNSDEANIFHVAVRFIIFHKIFISFTFLEMNYKIFYIFQWTCSNILYVYSTIAGNIMNETTVSDLD